MTRAQSLTVKFLVFLAGAGIIVIVFLLTSGERALNQTGIFMWVSIALIYVFLFFPFFFSSFRTAAFSPKIPSVSMIWIGAALYTALSIYVLRRLVFLRAMLFTSAAVVQAILVFLFFVDVYFACLLSSHIGKTAALKAGKRRFRLEIKSKAKALSLSLKKLTPEYKSVKKTLKQTLSDITRAGYTVYSDPVEDGPPGVEARVIESLDKLVELSSDIPEGEFSEPLEIEAGNLRALADELAGKQ